MKTIMIVEDDESIRFGLHTVLSRQGYRPVACSSLAEGREKCSAELDLVLLDWHLPDGTGGELCTYIKERFDVPVIFLTVRDEEQDIVEGLDMGADDYIVKPFPFSVLLSRINAVLRRSAPSPERERWSCGGIVVDRKRMSAYASDTELALTAGEYRLLSVLVEHKNQTLTRTQLLDKLWDIDGNFVNDNTLTVTMKRLREKLQHPACLKTIRGIGYRMEDGE